MNGTPTNNTRLITGAKNIAEHLLASEVDYLVVWENTFVMTLRYYSVLYGTRTTTHAWLNAF